MTIKPTISVAMATYNGERFLQEQLDSFVEQSRKPDELVVTDDGSTDRTLEILRDFQGKAPFPVRIYQNEERLNYTGNFAKAMSLCSGDVIFLSDQDDVWFPNKIKRVAAEFEAHPQTMVISNDQILTDEKLAHNGVTYFQNIRSASVKESSAICGCCTALRRNWRDLSLPIPTEDMAHDYWVNRLSFLLGVHRTLAEPLQYYRRHGRSATNWIISSPWKVSAFDTFRQHGLRDARLGWYREMKRIELCLQRLKERAGLLHLCQLGDVWELAEKRITKEIQAYEKRIALMDLPRWRRLPAVAKFSMEGGYADFLGWKSALKDVLR